MAAEAQEEVQHFIHTIGLMLRITFILAWIGALVYAAVKIRSKEDLYALFLKAGRNLEANVTTGRGLFSLTDAEFRNPGTLVQRLRDMRPNFLPLLSLTGPEEAPSRARAASAPPPRQEQQRNALLYWCVEHRIGDENRGPLLCLARPRLQQLRCRPPVDLLS